MEKGTIKDILGNDLYIGDFILSNHKKYSGLIICKIFKFTPKSLKAFFYYDYSKNKLDHSIFTQWQIVKVESLNNISESMRREVEIMNSNEHYFI